MQQAIIVSISTRCRDGGENILGNREGRRILEALMKRIPTGKSLAVRGVHCMSLCKRPCVVSFMSANSFIIHSVIWILKSLSVLTQSLSFLVYPARPPRALCCVTNVQRHRESVFLGAIFHLRQFQI